jgi:hypothetical protein
MGDLMRSIPAVILAAVCLTGAHAASGQNLVTNPSFGTSLVGWTSQLPGGTADGNSWATTDAGLSNLSGSARIDPLGTTPSSSYARLVQCVPASAGVAYSYGTRAFARDGQDGDGYVAIDLQFWSQTGCTGTATGISTALKQGPDKGVWHDLTMQSMVAPAGSQSALVMLTVNRKQGSKFAAHFDDVWLVAGKGCRANNRYLCLNGNRFEADLAAQDPRTGQTAEGVVVEQSGVFGYFGFPALTGDADNAEVFVKVLDGRPINGRFWVFYSGLTDLEFALKVRDLESGDSREYTKPGLVLESAADTSAF